MVMLEKNNEHTHTTMAKLVCGRVAWTTLATGGPDRWLPLLCCGGAKSGIDPPSHLLRCGETEFGLSALSLHSMKIILRKGDYFLFQSVTMTYIT